ncbi:MAG: fibronectin type III domain-containing protein [bacterium]
MNRLIISLLTLGLVSSLVFAGTPNKVMESNITDTQFTISWISQEPEIGLIKYSGTKTTLDKIAYDDRGSRTVSTTHYVTVTGLSPQTTYYYEIISGDTTVEDFELTTAEPVIPTGNDLVYGKIFQADGKTPAEDIIVYLRLQDYDNKGSQDKSALYSTLVNCGGYWYVNLVNFRTQNLTRPFRYSSKGDHLLIQVEGGYLGNTTLEVDTKDDTPAPDLILP